MEESDIYVLPLNFLMKLQKELDAAIALAYEAADAIMPIYEKKDKGIETKKNGTPVTIADKLANSIILEGILKKFPQDGIVSEEMKDVEGKRCWYVDPIDGTKAFINKAGEFCIMIGLAIKEKPVLGVIYRPTTDEMYYGVKNHGAYKKVGKKVQKIEIENSPVIDSYVGENLPNSIFQAYPELHSYDMWSEGLRIMELVEGKADVHYLGKYNHAGTWDICAPQAILEAAGGVIRYIDGEKIMFSGQRTLENRIVAGRTRSQVKIFRDLLK